MVRRAEAEAPARGRPLRGSCRIEWYDADHDSRLWGRRILFLSLEDGRYALLLLLLSALVKKSEIEEMREAADALVAWLGDDAVEIEAPV